MMAEKTLKNPDLAVFAEKLSREESVALFCHVHPDGDTLGSACALKIALVKLGKTCEVFCSDTIPEKYLFLPEIQTVKNVFCGKFSAYVAIDNAEVSRLGDFAPLFSEFFNTYNIDHHVSNNRYAKFNYVAERSSNCENVFDLIDFLGVEVDTDIANLLYLGLMTDTGNFHHKNVTEETFLSAARLVKYGADFNSAYYNAFTRQSKNRAKLFGSVMKKIRYFEEGKIAVISVLLSDFEETQAKRDETEGFIDFVMGIIGVKVGVCLMETEKDKFKVSLRSKEADVNAVASVFGGGGHKLASGCRINGEYEDAVDRVVSAVRRFLD